MRPARLLSSLLLLVLFVGRASGNDTPVQPPTLDIGAPTATVAYRDPLHLTATIAGQYSYVYWTASSGPSNVEFDSYGNTMTTAYFPQPGTYTITARLYYGFAGQSVTDTVTVTALPALAASTRLTMTSEPGDPVGGGLNHDYTPQTGNFYASGNYNGGVTVNYSGTYLTGQSYNYWTLNFAPGFGPLKPGVYSDARSYHASDSTRPRMDINHGQISAETTGSFEIKKIVWGPGDRVIALWATFEQHFAGRPEALRGEIRYNVDTTEPSVNRPPQVEASRPLRVRLPDALTLAGRAADDDLPAAGSLVTTWSKQSGPGEVVFADAHALDTTATFSTPGYYELVLSATDGAFTARDTLYVAAIDPAEETSLTLVSEPGDPIGGGVLSLHRDVVDGGFGAAATGPALDTSYAGNDEYWSFHFRGPAQSPLHVGRYEVGVAYHEPGLGVYSADLDHQPWTSSFEVKKIIYGEYGTVKAFWITFELRATGATGALRGELKYHAELDVPSDNRAPGAYAGADQRVAFPGPLTLHGIADDDMPATMTTTWSKVSGPGDATFADASALDTTATFSAPGAYVIALTASDGVLNKEDTMEVLVVAPDEPIYLRIASEPGDPIGAGEQRTYTRLDTNFSIYANTYNGSVSISAHDAVGGNWHWSATFTMPYNRVLQRGIYNDAEFRSYSSPHLTRPGLVVARSGFHPSDGYGSFTIREIQLGQNGEVLAFSATFTQRSAAGSGALTGEVRYNSAVSQDFTPVVSAGPDLTIDRLGKARLAGRAADDSLLGAALPVEWTKVSGPGEVVFADANAENTTATFSAVGTYVLRLSASDGTRTSSDEVTVTKTALETSLRLHAEATGAGGLSGDWFYNVDDGEFSVNAFSDLVFHFNSPDYSDAWNAYLAAPLGQTLGVGAYENATNFSARTTTHGAAALGNSSRSFVPAGDGSRFDIHDLTVSGGNVTSCLVTFTIVAVGTTISGEFRYNVPLNLFPRITLPAELNVFGSSVQLDAIVSDGDLPEGSALTLQWSSVGAVTFDTPTAASTRVHFAESGDYLLRLTASDGETTTEATILVHVVIPRGRWTGFVVIPSTGVRGYAQLAIGANGAFTGWLRAGARRITLRGVLGPDAGTTVSITLGGRAVTVTIRPGADVIELDVAMDGFVTSSELLNRQLPPAVADGAAAGSYAFLFNSLDGAVRRGVDGSWGKVTVRRSGAVAIIAVLADGTRVSGSSALDADDAFSALLPVARTNDWFALRATFGGAGNDRTWGGDAHWSRQATPARSKLEADLIAVGAPIARLAAGVEPLTGGRVPRRATLSIGFSGRAPLALPLTIHPGGRISGFGGGRMLATFRLNADGVFSGFVVDPATRKLLRFSGILVSYFGYGQGFALGASAGTVTLAP